MFKKSKILSIMLSILAAIVLIASFPTAAGAWTAYNFYTVQIGDYTWYNYDFIDQTASYTNTDWPISMIFWGPGAEADAAHALLWFWNIAGIQDARYYDGSNWEWDSDAGRKSALGDEEAWHARIYAETSGNRCTHSVWDYYVVASTHKDCLSADPEYFGVTNSANQATVGKIVESLGWDVITWDFLYMYNYEDYRLEGTEPYHLWDFDGYAEGVYME